MNFRLLSKKHLALEKRILAAIKRAVRYGRVAIFFALFLAAALTIQKRGFLLEKAASIYAKAIPQHRQALDLDADGAKAPDVVPLEERLKKYGEDAAIESADNVTRMQKRA